MVQTRPHPQNLRAPLVLICAVLVLFLALLAACLSRPALAFADYSMPKVNIQAQAETDGSLHVVEQRTFDFDGDCSSVQWSFSNLPSNAEVAINSVRIVRLGTDGGTTGYPQVLNSVPFVLEWRDSGGPGRDAYSFDQARSTVYVFFDAANDQRLIELDYTVKNGATAYSDVSEVYWQFIGEQWPVASENVEMSLALPVPSGVTVEPGRNVRAWGHGSPDGVVEINEDGSVHYSIPRVEGGSYAEARVVFPSDWLTNLPSGTAQPHRTEAHLSSVLAEEQVWADQANRSRVASLSLVFGSALVCSVALGVALWAYLRYGREHIPRFKGKYWKSVPDPTVHPAVIGRLWRWNRQSSDDFVATVMHLGCSGALSIEHGARPKADQPSGASQTDYLLMRNEHVQPANPLDRKALAVLFDTVADGSDSVWFSQIAEYGKDNPRHYLDEMNAWESLLSAETAKEHFFDEKGKAWQKRLVVLAVILVLCGVVVWLASGELLPVAFAVLSGAGVFLLGNYCERRTREGNELCAKCKALRNWLRDTGSREGGPSSDDATLGELMVYAYLFGVAGEAVEGILSKSRRTAATEPSRVRADAVVSTVPFWLLWFAVANPAAHDEAQSAGDALQESLSQTETAAHSALSSGSTGFLSAIGSGGGFSSGGGGDFPSAGEHDRV